MFLLDLFIYGLHQIIIRHFELFSTFWLFSSIIFFILNTKCILRLYRSGEISVIFPTFTSEISCSAIRGNSPVINALRSVPPLTAVNRSLYLSCNYSSSTNLSTNWTIGAMYGSVLGPLTPPASRDEWMDVSIKEMQRLNGAGSLRRLAG